IRGIILFPGRDDGLTVYPELDWSAFSTVLIGYNPLLTHFNQVVSDYYYDIDCALRKVDEAGLKRVGFAITRRVDDHTNQRWASRFLYFQQRTPKRDQVPVLISETDLEHREAVAPWYFKHRPEVILVAGSGVQGNLQDAGVRVPEDVRLINLVQRDEPEMAGINPFTEELGRAAIEQLASQLQSNQVGLPAYPAVISIKGVWSPGASFPESKTFAV
ncbi:MAG: substrate-binding domain-containing protein, partial [Puniceicoccales bacterium]